MIKSDQLVNILIFAAPFIALLSILVFNIAIQFPLPSCICLIGFILFLKAKLSVSNKKDLISFGFAKMDQLNKFFYVFGYFLMIVGCLVLLRMG